MEDHYKTLQVQATASVEEIERAYRRLARQNHPDLLRQVSPARRQQAEDRLKQINLAHHVLGDRERRRAYDLSRRAGGRMTPAPATPTPRPAPATPRRVPAAARTTHWGASGPIDIEWSTPPRPPRPDTDIFSSRRLIRYAIAIIIFTAILSLLWQPRLKPPVTPTIAPPAIVTPVASPAVPGTRFSPTP